MQRVNLNTEEANNTKVGSARRMLGNSAEISIQKPKYIDFCFMEVDSSSILSSHLEVFSPTGFTDVNITQTSSCCRQSLPDENFRKLIKNLKSEISLFFFQTGLLDGNAL